MKRLSGLSIIIILILLVTSCTTADVEEEVKESSNFQDEMMALKADLEERLEVLGSENDRLKKEISDIQKKHNKEIIDLKSSIIVDKDDLFQVDNHTFRIDIIGKEILEDGVIVILEGYDGLKLQWVKTWESIQVAELALISGLTLWEDKVYVVVDGNLNIIDLVSGKR